MVDRFYGYQSETSPRQIQPEYRPYKNKYPEKRIQPTTNQVKPKVKTVTSKNKKSVTPKKKKEVIVKAKPIEKAKHIEKTNEKKSLKPRVRLVFLILTGFSILFIISYMNSMINETFSKKEDLKSELSKIQKTNEQLQVSIENSLNLNNVEQEAKERVGMQKLTNSQKIYVNLEKKDYVESATEQIIIKEEGNIFERIIEGFTKSVE